MNKLEEINRAVNKSLRILNDIAVSVSSSTMSNRKEALKEIVQALAHLDKFQRMVVDIDPTLEYHYDPNKQPSQFMSAISQLVETAESCISSGKVSEAEAAYLHALEMEPPPLIYKIIEKRLNELKLSN